MKRLLIALCFALSIAPISRAADAAHLELIGFSRDGAFLAFTQFGVQDGSGFPYAYTSFVGVKNNRLEAELGGVIKDNRATTEQVWAKTRVQVAAAMLKYSIIAGNQGRFIAVTPPHSYTTISEFFAFDRTYGLSIATKPAISTVDYCIAPPQLLIVKLTVSGKPRDLQRDTRLPASRDCAYGYEMRSAHLYARSLAVFVSYQTVGFEGADSRWMVVTATL